MLIGSRRLVAGAAVVCAIVAGSWSYFSRRMYVANASFVPQDRTSSQSLLGQLAPQLGLQLGSSSANSPEFYASLMQSNELQRDVATTTYHLAAPAPFDGDLVKYFRIDAPTREQVIMRAVRRVRGMLSVTNDRATGVVSFSVTADNPDLAAQIASRLLDLVNEYNLRRQQTQAGAQRSFFEARLNATQQQLDSAENAYAAFLNRNRLYLDSPQLRAEAGRLERVATLRQQLYLSLSHDYEVARLEELRNTPVIMVIQHPEGFVERKARGTLLRIVVGLVLGGLLGAFLAFGRDYLRRQRSATTPEYAAFRQAADAALAGLGLRVRRG